MCVLLEGRGGERRGGIRARVLGYGEVYCWIGGGGGGLSASGIGKGGPQLHPREDSMLCRRGSAVWLCPPHAGMGGGGEEGGQVNQASPTPHGDSR